MTRNRFASVDSDRIQLSDGLWIEVKSELDAGDQRKMDSLAVVPIVIDEKIVDRVDWSKYELLRTHLWLTGWNLTRLDKDGKDYQVPLSIDSLAALTNEDFDEINSAVYKHIMTTVMEKKSKRMKGLTIPPADKGETTSQ